MEMADRCPAMAAAFCSDLKTFCSRLESSCKALNSACQMPADPNSGEKTAAFVQKLNDKIVSLTNDIDIIKSMSICTLPFEDLISHATDLFKQNEKDIELLETELQRYGYAPGSFVEKAAAAHEEESNVTNDRSQVDNNRTMLKGTYSNVPRPTSVPSIPNDIEDVSPLRSTVDGCQVPDADSLFLESLSLTDIGLSASSLAALSNEGSLLTPPELRAADPVLPSVKQPSLCMREEFHHMSEFGQSASSRLQDNAVSVQSHVNLEINASSCNNSLEQVANEEFSSLPSWLKWQVTLEDLNNFVVSISSLLYMDESGLLMLKDKDIASMAYAEQTKKASLLILVRLQMLEIAHVDGAKVYCVSKGKTSK